jgi:hypothetical protein
LGWSCWRGHVPVQGEASQGYCREEQIAFVTWILRCVGFTSESEYSKVAVDERNVG